MSAVSGFFLKPISSNENFKEYSLDVTRLDPTKAYLSILGTNLPNRSFLALTALEYICFNPKSDAGKDFKLKMIKKENFLLCIFEIPREQSELFKKIEKIYKIQLHTEKSRKILHILNKNPLSSIILNLPAHPQIFSLTDIENPSSSLEAEEAERESQHIHKFADWLQEEIAHGLL